MIGISGSWKDDMAFGAIIGLLFITMNIVIPNVMVIGIPETMSLALQAGLVIVVVVAPLVEEPLFRSITFGILDKATGNRVLAIFGQAMAFSLYHWRVYGMGLQTAFVGAFVFALLAQLVTIERKSIVPAIFMHMLFNLFLFSQQLVMVYKVAG